MVVGFCGVGGNCGMGLFSEVEELAARAQFMRESLGKSQSITDSMITILGSFDHRLSTLETAMRPTQVRKEKKSNLLRSLSPLSHILSFFDFCSAFFGGCNAEKTGEG
jgi:exocyst complex protein 7